MKGAIEFFVGMVVLVLLAILGTTYLSASINSANARDYHTSVVNEIEASNFSEGVIQALYRDADQKGYLLKPIQILELNGWKKAEVILGYTYSVGLLNSKGEQHYIRGYAR